MTAAQLHGRVEALGVPCSDAQAAALVAYGQQVVAMNARLNLIARTDVQHVLERHVLHCAVLARRGFPDGACVVDWGTGGGLPLVPLAVLRPEATYVGVDAVEKKTLAVRQMARAVGATNATAWHGRAEAYPSRLTHSVSRATAPLATLWGWHARAADGANGPHGDAPSLKAPDTSEAWPRGLVCLKGGDLTGELAALHVAFEGLRVDVSPVPLSGAYYADKHVVLVTAR